MRQSTAIVVVVLLALASAGDARADDTTPAKEFRNPIEWLLSDIGKLLQTATSKVSENAAPADTSATRNESGDSQPAASRTDVPAYEEFTEAEPAPAASKPAPADADEAAVADGPDTAMQPAAKAFRNPLEWLLSDLARIFQPELEIEQKRAVANAPATAKQQVGTGDAAAPDSAVPHADTVVAEIELEAAPERLQANAPVEDPITWLFRGLTKLLSPKAENLETATAESVETPTPSEAHAGDVLTLPDNAQETVRISDVTETRDPAHKSVEIAPWVPRPENNLFNPDDSLFSTGGAPLLAAAPPARISKPVPETVIAALPEQAPAQSDIRQRPAHTPGARNHATLGREHKSVTPDPIDESLIDRVLENLFGIDGTTEIEAEAEETLANKVSDRIVPEESLDLGYTSPDAVAPDQKLTRLGDGPLDNIDLYMGSDSVIGAPYIADAHMPGSCVERALHGSVFCLKQLNWPSAIATSFATDTAFVLPGEGVVRYENGAISRVYAVFNASEFADVVKYMQQRFGPPQEREIGWMHMLEAPKLPNTTFRWQAFNAERTDAIVLEVRNYDDLRRSFADMDHGMVRLYRNGSRPIFKHISTMDLMLMQRRRLARAPVEVNQPPKQQ
jgi:hypothetical protein